MQRKLCCFTFLALLILYGPQVESRPPYFSTFKKVYPELAKKKISCAICHPTRQKTELNHYGAALRKELGEKRVKDEKRITEAIRKIEDGKCQSGCWSERLKSGLAPCVDREIVEEHSVITRWLNQPFEGYKPTDVILNATTQRVPVRRQ